MNKIKEAVAKDVIPWNSPLFRSALKLTNCGLFERVGRYLVRRYDGVFKSISVTLGRSKLTLKYDLLTAGDCKGELGLVVVKDYSPLAKWSLKLKECKGKERVYLEYNEWSSIIISLPFPTFKLKMRGPKAVKIEEFMSAYGTYYVTRTLALGKFEARELRPGLYGFSK